MRPSPLFVPSLLLMALACAGVPSTDAPLVAAQGPGLSVKDFGAKGDGWTSDTAAVQAAVDAAPAGGVVTFPPGTYRIDTDRGIQLKDDLRVELGEATLVGSNVDGARCRILEVQGRKNVVITGGTLLGSRGGSPEWAVGILASDADDLVIERVTLRDFFFDGILLTGNRGCRRVVVRGVLADSNRRTGLAIPSADDVTVESSRFSGSHGQSPQAGINCEPGPGASVRNIRIRGSTFSGNAGVGLYIHRALGVNVAAITIEDNVVEANDQGIVAAGVDQVSLARNQVRGHRARGRSGIAIGQDTHTASVALNELADNFRGIVSAGATNVEIRGNTVAGTGPGATAGAGEDGDGIVCRGLRSLLAEACVVAGNTVRSVAGSGILLQLVSQVQLLDNTISGTGQRGIYLRSVTASVVSGNNVSTVGGEASGRYDGIELSDSSNQNVVSSNVCRLGPGMRNAIGIGPGCAGNQLQSNVVLP